MKNLNWLFLLSLYAFFSVAQVETEGPGPGSEEEEEETLPAALNKAPSSKH
jgi:hypothetical protein